MFEHNLKCRCVGSFEESFERNLYSRKSLPQASKFFIPEAKPHFAPDRFVDVEQIKLEIEVDLKEKKLWGKCSTQIRGVAPITGKVVFDAIDLEISKVTDKEGNELIFDRTQKKITIFLGKGIRAGDHETLIIEYSVREPRAGLYFISPDSDYPDRPWQLWTQGQDEDNRYWIPCLDSPVEKAASEMIVTVDDRYGAISNGKLIEVTQNAKKKTKTFHWKQSIPHASYLITLCVGEFSEIEDKWKNSKGNEIPVTYYTLPGREPETKVSFGKTPKMLDFFSKKIGVDYPFEKYAQVVAWDFIYGGMENTSSTTQTEYTLHPEEVDLDYSSEPLVAHELAHQWFGDLLTCKEWAHAWLNEGFATYFESLWMQEEHGNDEFLYELYLNEKIFKGEDSGDYRRPLVTNVYLAPSDIFDRHLYEKGGRVLHMLRSLVGDELWWIAIKKYVTENYAKTVETVDLQRAFEETSGRTLSWFFEQWVYKAGFPEIKASYEWIEEKKLAKFSLNQAQKTDDLTSIFKFPLQIKIVTSDGEYIHEVMVDEKEKHFAFASNEKPKFVSLNVENTILGSWDFNPGRDLLIEQLKKDRDVMGRIYAAKVLSKDMSRASVEALGEALRTEKFWGVQREICEALASIGSKRCQEILLDNCEKISHPRARSVAIRAIGSFRNELSAELGEKIMKTDRSPLCQYEAGIALGKSRQPGVYEKLFSLLGKRESWHDYLDRGILAGMSELKTDERVFNLLVKYSKPGVSVFTRREAIESLTRYAKARPTLLMDYLLDMTKDSNFFVKLSAISAMETLGDTRGIGALQRLVDIMVEPRIKRAALLAIKSIRDGANTNEEVDKMKSELDRMRDDYKALLSRLEKLEKIEPEKKSSDSKKESNLNL